MRATRTRDSSPGMQPDRWAGAYKWCRRRVSGPAGNGRCRTQPDMGEEPDGRRHGGQRYGAGRGPAVPPRSPRTDRLRGTGGPCRRQRGTGGTGSSGGPRHDDAGARPDRSARGPALGPGEGRPGRDGPDRRPRRGPPPHRGRRGQGHRPGDEHRRPLPHRERHQDVHLGGRAPAGRRGPSGPGHVGEHVSARAAAGRPDHGAPSAQPPQRAARLHRRDVRPDRPGLRGRAQQGVQPPGAGEALAARSRSPSSPAPPTRTPTPTSSSRGC